MYIYTLLSHASLTGARWVLAEPASIWHKDRTTPEQRYAWTHQMFPMRVLTKSILLNALLEMPVVTEELEIEESMSTSTILMHQAQ
jgi:hypothetical protein